MKMRGGSVRISRPGTRTDKLLKMSGIYELMERIS